MFGSQITTVAVIECECTQSTCNDEQLSDTCSTNMPLSTVESLSTAVCFSTVQSALQSEHSEIEENTSGSVEEICTEQDAPALIKDLWSKPEHERP